jgi:hypothetical protein
MYQLRCNRLHSYQQFVIVILLVCGTTSALGSSRPKLDVRWVFINGPLTWTPAPKDPELPKYATASANIVVFYPSGDFVNTTFWVGHDKHGMFILPGEGFALRRGHWSREGNRILVTSQLSYSEKLGVLRPPKKSSAIEETWLAQGKAKGSVSCRLIAPSRTYVPLRGLRNLDEFEDIITTPPRGDSTE